MKLATAILCALCLARMLSAAPEPPPPLLLPSTNTAGYLAHLLVNESPFPGERGYVSEENTRETMRALLLVIDARINRIPRGYTRREVADTTSTNVIEIITAGAGSGQMEGFFLDTAGNPAMAPRVSARVDNLIRIANQGEPGRFVSLLTYAQTLASNYILKGTKPAPDIYAGITYIRPASVTGSAYGWMTDMDYYHPGGNFVRIPDRMKGRLGGNRFYTLVKKHSIPAKKPAGRQPLVTPKPSPRS